MAEKKFSELETAANLDGSEYAAVSQSQSGVLTSVKATLQAIANWIASGSRYASALNTQDKTLTGAINEVLADAGSDVSVTNTIPSSNETKRVATVTVDGTPTDINADDTEAILRRVFGEHIVEGNPVTFDAYLGLETVKSLTLTMNPIQDLHGYDNPWVGGAGKNKLDKADSSVSANSTWLNENCNLPAGTYTFSFKSSATGGQCTFNVFDSNNNRIYNAPTIQLASTTIHTFTISSAGARVSSYINAASNISEVMIEEGSTKTDFAPYENICPISGRDSVDVVISDGETESTKTIAFPSTVYGGTDEVVIGTGTSTYGYITSYDGEELPGYWISDRDVYAEGTTPTTGAEVCYELATPTPFSTTPTQIGLNKGNNVVSSNADELELKYSVG